MTDVRWCDVCNSEHPADSDGCGVAMYRRPYPRFRDRLIGFLSVQPDVRVDVGFYDDIDLARFVARMLEYDQ